jgi:hypothetical protein
MKIYPTYIAAAVALAATASATRIDPPRREERLHQLRKLETRVKPAETAFHKVSDDAISEGALASRAAVASAVQVLSAASASASNASSSGSGVSGSTSFTTINGTSVAGVTTRYWDCCKPSCAWNGKAQLSSNLQTCDASGNVLSDQNAQSGCTGGTAFMCSDQGPKVVSDTLALGTAAVALAGTTEADTCCSCYKLDFQGALAGKTLIVQATNTGSDVGSDQFDLGIPGGGQGIFSGCTTEFGSQFSSVWGEQYGGISSASDCSALPAKLQAGCNFRFNWMQGVSNPSVTYTEVTCPAALVAMTGCQRA